MKNLQRKAIQTWAVGTPGLIVLLWLAGVPPRRETTDECFARVGGWAEMQRCLPELRRVDEDSLFYIADHDWTPGVQLIGATTVVLVLFIAYLRIWKRPDES